MQRDLLRSRGARAVVVVACSATFFAVAALARSNTSTATKIRVRGGEFFFKPNVLSARRGKVTLIFKNVGHVRHDLKIAGKRTPMVAPGKTATLVLRLTKRGTYRFVCTVPGHAQAGMRGVLKVR